MVLSVVNLQEAYAKALLVDRGALAAAQAAGDVLGGHELLLDAYQTDVRPLCATVRAELGAAEDPVAELRVSGYAASAAASRTAQPTRRSQGGLGTMSITTRMVAPAEDRWPERRGGPTTRSRRCCSPLTCSAATGHSPTSAAATPRPREPPPTTSAERSRAMWVKGSGSDLATMAASDFTPLRLDEIAAAVRARSDERRADGRPPGALPARPRGAALVDRDAPARVRSGRPRAPHPPRRDQRRWPCAARRCAS